MASGQQVVLAVNHAVHSLAARAGLATAPCGPPFGPEQARQPPAALPLDLKQPWPEIKKWESFLRDVPAKYHDLAAACRGADLLVAHSFRLCGHARPQSDRRTVGLGVALAGPI
jgi:hypothetical protein